MYQDLQIQPKKRYCTEFGREMPMKMSICKCCKFLSEAIKGKALVKGHSLELSSFCFQFKKSNIQVRYNKWYTKFCEVAGDLKLTNAKCCNNVIAKDKQFLYTLCCDIISRLENNEIITSKIMLSDKATFPKARHNSQQTIKNLWKRQSISGNEGKCEGHSQIQCLLCSCQAKYIQAFWFC